MAERPLDIRVAEPGQTFAGRLAGRHSGEALFDVAVLLDVQGDDRVEAGAGVGVEVAPGDELVGQALGFVARPGLEGGDELALVDQPVLKCEQSEQEMAVRGGGHGMAPICSGRTSTALMSGTGPEFRSWSPDYRNSARHLHPCRCAASASDNCAAIFLSWRSATREDSVVLQGFGDGRP